MATPKRITLGSGKLYVMPYVDSVPETETICTEENLIGYIKGGASIEYTPSFYEAKDDLGYVIKTIITEETAILKSGILTFNGNTLKMLCATGRVSEDKSKKLRTLKIGGIGNADNSKYVICFHHEDSVDGDIWVVIVGKNEAGFTLAFAKDSETVIDAEFKCLSQDEEGTLIKYIESDATITGEEG